MYRLRVRGGAQPHGLWGCSGRLRGAVSLWPLVSLSLLGAGLSCPGSAQCARLSALHTAWFPGHGVNHSDPSPEGQSLHLSPHSCPWSAPGDPPSLPLSGCTWPSCLLGATEQKVLASALSCRSVDATPVRGWSCQWTDRLRRPSQGRLQAGTGSPGQVPFVQPSGFCPGGGRWQLVPAARRGVDSEQLRRCGTLLVPG